MAFLLAERRDGNSRDVLIRLCIALLGFAPIGCLSVSAFGWLPLHVTAPWIVLPAAMVLVAVVIASPHYGATLLKGVLLGVIAVFIYDLTCRFPFMALGLWPDFIPKIGNYLLDQDNTPWWVGYLWRYLGNGGGMGMAFFAILPLLPRRINAVWLGVVYGIMVFCCLLATVYLSPMGRTYLFDPSLLTAMMGFSGHFVFGMVLGYGGRRMYPLLPIPVSFFPSGQGEGAE